MKEIILTLNTGKETFVTHTTSKINGIIQAIIIDSDKPIDITISLSEFPDIILYDDRGFIGQIDLPLQQEPISPDNQKLNFGTAKWALNDRLNITVKNNFNTIVKFIIRYI